MGVPVFEVETWPAWHINEWQQFYTLRPFGAWRDNYHAAVIADTLAKVNGAKGSEMKHYFYIDQETAQEERKARDFATFKQIADTVRILREQRLEREREVSNG